MNGGPEWKDVALAGAAIIMAVVGALYAMIRKQVSKSQERIESLEGEVAQAKLEAERQYQLKTTCNQICPAYLSQLQEFKSHVTETYVRNDAFREFRAEIKVEFDRLINTLEKIFDKLDQKADK